MILLLSKHLIFTEPSLEPTPPLLRALSRKNIWPAVAIGRSSIRLAKLDRDTMCWRGRGTAFCRNRRRSAIAGRTILWLDSTIRLLHIVPVVGRSISLENWTTPEALESVLLAEVWLHHGWCALDGAAFAAGIIRIGLAVAAIGSVGVYCVSRLLISLARVDSITLSIVVTIPSWI